LSLWVRGDVNALNAVTVILGIIAGLLAFAGDQRPLVLGLAEVILILGLAPALFGGVGLLYLPSVVLIAIGLRARLTGDALRLRNAGGT